jgi:hypothetical protein
MQSPCKDCHDRHRNCHSRCEEYQAYHDENVRRNAENRNAHLIVEYKKSVSARVEKYLFSHRRK